MQNMLHTQGRILALEFIYERTSIKGDMFYKVLIKLHPGVVCPQNREPPFSIKYEKSLPTNLVL